MVRYSKPLQNEYKYMRVMTKKKYRQYVKERQGDRQSFDLALIRTMVKMNSEADISDEMFGALLIDEFIAHSIPSYYMQNAELKDFLLETECIKDFAAVKEFVLEHGANFEDSNNGGYMTLHVRVPGETDAYTFMLMTSKEVDSIVIMTMHGLERKVYILNVNSRGVAHDELKLILNLIYYVLAFPDALVDGKPRQAEPDPEHAAARKYTLHTDKRVVEHEEGEKQHRVTHFRRGHFRRLSSDYYKNKQGQVIFIHASLVKGTAAKTVLG